MAECVFMFVFTSDCCTIFNEVEFVKRFLFYHAVKLVLHLYYIVLLYLSRAVRVAACEQGQVPESCGKDIEFQISWLSHAR